MFMLLSILAVSCDLVFPPFSHGLVFLLFKLGMFRFSFLTVAHTFQVIFFQATFSSMFFNQQNNIKWLKTLFFNEISKRHKLEKQHFYFNVKSTLHNA